MKRVSISLVTMAATALLVTGCSSFSPGSGSGPTSGPGSAGSTGRSQAGDTSGAPSSPAPTSSQPPPSPPPVASVECTGAELTVAGKALPGAAGHQGVVLLISNQGSEPCYVSGYPGADGTDSGGFTIASAARTLNGMLGGCHCTKPATVSLQPDGVASAVIEANIGGPGPCDPFVGLLVTPPNTSTSTPLQLQLPSCGFQVHPVVAGSTGGSPG